MSAARRIAKEEAAGGDVALAPLHAGHAAALHSLLDDWEVVKHAGGRALAGRL